MSTDRREAVQVLERAAALLDVLADAPDRTAPQLAERAGMPRSTVYRLLGALQGFGWVEQGAERGTYRLGLGLLRLGRVVSSSFDERARALPAMQRLREATGQTVYLAVRRGLQAVCIERLDGVVMHSHALRLGGMLPLHAGGGPKALLAFAPPDVRAQVLAAPLAPLTQHTLTTAVELDRELTATRERGYAVSDQDVAVGVAALGVPVFDDTGEVRAALSLSGLAPAILPDCERLGRLLMATATEVSASLGYEATVAQPA